MYKELRSQAKAEKHNRLSSYLGHADGGKPRAKKKAHKTEVNVVVAPRGGERPVPVPIPVRGATGVPGQQMPSPAPVRPQVQPVRVVQPNPMGAKKGGRVKKAHGGSVRMTAGAESGIGRLEKAAIQKMKNRSYARGR